MSESTRVVLNRDTILMMFMFVQSLQYLLDTETCQRSSRPLTQWPHDAGTERTIFYELIF